MKKIYTVTVIKKSGNELFDACGKSGLKALLKSVGLGYDKLRSLYAEKGVEAQVKLEWSNRGPWNHSSLVRPHIFET